MALSVVFMGTPDFSVPTLMAIAGAGHRVVAVYSQPPRPKGRGLETVPSPVHQAALGLGIPVFTPKSLKGAAEQAQFASHNADAAVVVAYGLLLPKQILEAPRLGCLNGHASRLPRWRGAAPIQRAIMAGDRETAMMIMRMDEGLDTGPVCLSKPVAITPSTTAGDLHDILAREGGPLMAEALALLEAGRLPEHPQPAAGVTYAAKISKDEAQINFAMPSSDVLAHIHGLSPFPGAWFEAKPRGSQQPERIKVLRAKERDHSGGAPGAFLDSGRSIACSTGAIELVEVQRAGKKPMGADDFLRGFAVEPTSTVVARG
jgi:methionyl-tRNA formyltransferase